MCWLISTVLYTTQNSFCLTLCNRRRLICCTTNKAHYSRSLLYQMPCFIIHFHLNHDVTRVKLTFTLTLFTITRSEEHTSELQSRPHLVCRLLLEKKKKKRPTWKSGSTNHYAQRTF